MLRCCRLLCLGNQSINPSTIRLVSWWWGTSRWCSSSCFYRLIHYYLFFFHQYNLPSSSSSLLLLRIRIRITLDPLALVASILVAVDIVTLLALWLVAFDIQEGFSFPVGLGTNCTLYRFCDPSFSRILSHEYSIRLYRFCYRCY